MLMKLRAPLQHRRMNERHENKMRTRPHSTAPDWRLTENAGPIAAQGAVAADAIPRGQSAFVVTRAPQSRANREHWRYGILNLIVVS